MKPTPFSTPKATPLRAPADGSSGSATDTVAPSFPEVRYASVEVDGLEIFYREAGSRQNRTILLLHGFPTSSHMFRDLIPLLADRYHVVAPDYPGFGYSDAPDPEAFTYTFERLADVIEQFTDVLNISDFVVYAQDYGGPVGFRMAARRPETVKAFVIQNANAYEAGVTDMFRDIVLRLWTERTAETEAKVAELFELETTKAQYLTGAGRPELVSPDAWTHAQWGMDRPGNKRIQLELQANYGANVELYEAWHTYFREHQPPMLVTWGIGDFIFAPEGAHAYKDDLEDVDIHMLDTGHFALEERASDIADHIRRFLSARDL